MFTIAITIAITITIAVTITITTAATIVLTIIAKFVFVIRNNLRNLSQKQLLAFQAQFVKTRFV
jgi:hypothetical protein